MKVLFVGESRPAQGTFFYAADSTLSRYTAGAFEKAFRVHFRDHLEFLRYFMESGCYLTDMCVEPVNRVKEGNERLALCRRGIPRLTDDLRRWNPGAVVTIKKTLGPLVDLAIVASAVECKNYVLPFPAMGHQGRYERELTETLIRLVREKIVSALL